MKNYISISVGLILTFLSLSVALAANDATLEGSSAQLSVSGYTLVVTGSSRVIDSITVRDSNFDVVLQPATSFGVKSDDKRDFSVSPSTYVVITKECTTSHSAVDVTSNHDTGAITVTITPSTSSTCGGASGSGGAISSSSSGGGGGGGGSVPISIPVATTKASSVANPSAVALAVSPIFNTSIVPGARGSDVKRLQQILGVESTGFFGALTRKAVMEFQLKHGVIKSAKDVGAGTLGPKTRAKFKEVYTEKSAPVSVVEPVTPAPQLSVVQRSVIQAQIDNLKALIQALLAKFKKQ